MAATMITKMMALTTVFTSETPELAGTAGHLRAIAALRQPKGLPLLPMSGAVLP
jgi:hypothetical protein